MKVVFFILIVVGVLVFSMIQELRKQKQFIEKYPAISDDEFMTLLPPGTSRDVALKVRTIVSEQCGVERERIYPDATFVELFE